MVKEKSWAFWHARFYDFNVCSRCRRAPCTVGSGFGDGEQQRESRIGKPKTHPHKPRAGHPAGGCDGAVGDLLLLVDRFVSERTTKNLSGPLVQGCTAFWPSTIESAGRFLRRANVGGVHEIRLSC